MRISFKRYILFLTLIFIALLTWNTIRNPAKEHYTKTCNLPKKYHEDLHVFTDKVHKLLVLLELRHFLCYGSLWGKIRYSKLLPWEDKSVLCLFNEEVSTKNELFMMQLFKKNGFSLTYHSSEGQYVVTKINDSSQMKVFLVLFELDNVIYMYRRVGWKRRILPPDCELMESLHCFPPRLMLPPLPIKEFGGYLIPVPREGIELQKYLYKNNWWEEVPLKNC